MPADLPSVESFEELLRVEPAGEDGFTTRLLSFGGRSFGGETLGCAALAAARTCGGRSLHSLHACFLRPVPPEVPIELRIERMSEGRRFARRRVDVFREGRLLCQLLASFAAPGAGPEYQDTGIDPDTKPPEALPSDEEVARAEGWTEWWKGPLQWRYVGAPWRPESPEAPSRYRAWVRPRVPLARDPGLHAAVVAYLADVHSHWPIARKLGAHFEPEGFVSLDQVVWLHRVAFWEDWWLLTSESDVGHAGRALGRRSLHTRDGRLVASMAQETLVPGASEAPPGAA